MPLGRHRADTPVPRALIPRGTRQKVILIESLFEALAAYEEMHSHARTDEIRVTAELRETLSHPSARRLRGHARP